MWSTWGTGGRSSGVAVGVAPTSDPAPRTFRPIGHRVSRGPWSQVGQDWHGAITRTWPMTGRLRFLSLMSPRSAASPTRGGRYTEVPRDGSARAFANAFAGMALVLRY